MIDPCKGLPRASHQLSISYHFTLPFVPRVDFDDPYKAVKVPKQPKQEGSLAQHLRRDDRQLGFLPRSSGVRVA